MKAHTSKIVGEGLTYDDVLLIPNYSEVFVSKGNTLSSLQRYEEAMQCFDKAIQIDPNNAEAHQKKTAFEK
jgi:tetratricopeptide (TPR) repeat protein